MTCVKYDIQHIPSNALGKIIFQDDSNLNASNTCDFMVSHFTLSNAAMMVGVEKDAGKFSNSASLV